MTIITIDGPAGSGKSTVARALAERLSLPYLDTGAMYRVVAMVAIRRGVDFWDETSLTKIAAETKMQLLDERQNGKLNPRVVVMGVDATLDIRTPEVSQGASAVAIHPGVRERLVSRQRNWVLNRGGGVVEGRDIGTVVLPDAEIKIFLTASEEERARRRKADLSSPGFAHLSTDDVAKEMEERDKRDSTRVDSPLAVPDGALVVDTSGQDIEEVIIGILSELRARSGGELPTGSVS